MRKLIAKLFGLVAKECRDFEVYAARVETTTQRRDYYQQVLDSMHRNGTLPPNCDLKLPKASLRIVNTETGIVLAENGKWLKLPDDGEPVTISYKHD